jgi:hypothetical protein
VSNVIHVLVRYSVTDSPSRRDLPYSVSPVATPSTVATNYSQGYDDTIVDLWVDAIAAVGAGALVAGWLRGQAEADR